MTDFRELIIKIAKIFDNLKIPYVITGGYAVSVWGRPRSTFDIDVIIQLKTRDISPLSKSLRSLSKAGYIEESLAKESVLRGGEFNFIHSESGIKVDFWVIKENDSVGMAELKRKIGKNFDGQKIYFISPEDLILSKLRWFKKTESERHLEDARAVIKISKSRIDFSYLKNSAEEQGIDDILNKILQE